MTSWHEIERRFAQLGLDVYRLACGCSVKTDLEKIVYPALESLRPRLAPWGISIAARQEADIFHSSHPPPLQRLVVRRGQRFLARTRPSPPAPLPSVKTGEGCPQGRGEGLLVGGALRAVTLTSVRRPRSAEELARFWLDAYQRLAQEGLKFVVGKGHTIEADAPEHQFVLFDLFQADGEGELFVSNHDAIQIIDPTLDPGDFRQTAVALSNAINDLCALGAVQQITIFPALAAPTQKLLAQLQRNVAEFAARWGFSVLEGEPLPIQTLLLGATVLGRTDRQPPVFLKTLRDGDQVLIHRALGDLALIRLHLEGVVCGDSSLRSAKEEALSVMATPNIAVGRLIGEYSPAPQEPFDPKRHIKYSGDISGMGLGIFAELGVRVRFEKIPLVSEELRERGTGQSRGQKSLALTAPTASTNGALFVIALPEVIERFGADLASLGYAPHVIGRVCMG